MKRLGPSFAVFAHRFISKRRAEFRKRLRAGEKPQRLVLSEFRAKRTFLPKDAR
jgi:hypothetical protein